MRPDRVCSVLAVLALSPAVPTQDWSHWRGPSFNGATEAQDLPTSFDRENGVHWRTPMPGPGASTPIIVGENVFLTAAAAESGALFAICLDRASGEVRWQHDARSDYGKPDDGVASIGGSRATFASPSAVCDGERVVFFFGNGDLVAYSLAGEEAWRTNVQEAHGAFAFNWTFSASPTLWDGTLYLPVLQRDTPVRRGRGRGRGRRGGPSADAAPVDPIESFILALDPATGEETWRHVRPSPAQVESLESYTSIVPQRVGDEVQLLLAGGDVLTGHDPATGAELWRWGTWNEGHREKFWRLVPSVVCGDGVALVCAPKRAPVYAVALGGSGELETDALRWKSGGRPNPVSSDVPTPAFWDGHFFVLSDVQHAISKVHAKTGETIWTTDLSRDYLWRSSPTVADGRVWFMNHNGQVCVVDAESGEIALTADMGNDDDDHIRASIAIAHGHVFVRTNDSLFCIGG